MSLYITSFRTAVTNILAPLMRSQGMIDWISSLVGGLDTNMTDPRSVKAPSFNTWITDLTIKAKLNGQIILLRAGLQYITGLQNINVATGSSLVNKVFIYNKAEGSASYSYNKMEGASRFFTWNKAELPDAFDFNVSIPFEDASVDVINSITSWTKQLKLAGKSFNVTDDLMIASPTISSAQILTGNTVPVTIVAAPGAGNIIVPVMLALKYKFVTAAYATNTTINFLINGQVVFTVAAMISQAADRYIQLTPAQLGVLATLMENQALTFQVGTGNPTAGGGNLQLMLIYKIQAVV